MTRSTTAHTRRPDRAGRPRVVIVGGGFAGLFAARRLARGNVAVTLIDRAQHHVFQPLLYQCATGILSEGKIAVPLRELFKKDKNVDTVMAEVTGFDPAGRRVTARRVNGEGIEFGYDHLIVAAGVRQSYFGHDEFARWAPGMKTISDALNIRRRVYGAFEMAETATDPDERRRWLTFALVGAGPTGVELAGQIRAVATRTLHEEFRNIKPQDARVLLFDGGRAPLAAFGPKLSHQADRALQAAGVEQHMGCHVTQVDQDGVLTRDQFGEQARYDAGTILWTAGVEAPPLAAALAEATGAQRDKAGRILVQADLTIAGHPEICVLGDMMSLNELPGVAEVAMQSGLYTARRIRRQASGKPAGQPFRYHDLGSAAYISRGCAVVSAGPVHASGFLGWCIWLFIHITFMTGYRNRIGALLSWWPALTRAIRRERTFTITEIETPGDGRPSEDEPGRSGEEAVAASALAADTLLNLAARTATPAPLRPELRRVD